jgi:hypothetical protein
MTTNVRFPQMREHLELALAALSDVDFQRRVWVDGHIDPRDKWHHNFDEGIHTICDDLRFDIDPLGSIGNWTRDAGEAAAVATVAQAIDDLLERYGLELSDADYMRAPEWPRTTQLAGAALQTLRA